MLCGHGQLPKPFVLKTEDSGLAYFRNFNIGLSNFLIVIYVLVRKVGISPESDGNWAKNRKWLFCYWLMLCKAWYGKGQKFRLAYRPMEYNMEDARMERKISRME